MIFPRNDIVNFSFNRNLMLFLVLIAAGCSSIRMDSSTAAVAHVERVNPALERCDKPLGALAIVEDAEASWHSTLANAYKSGSAAPVIRLMAQRHEDVNAPWYRTLTNSYKLGSTLPVLRLLAQQSNCFVVVERSKRGAFADYTLNPSLTFSNNAGDAADNINFKETITLLTLIDNRSGVSLAAAKGSARNIDLGAMASLFDGHARASLGGYANTAEGKVIVAALADSFNNIIRAVRYKVQMGSEEAKPTATDSDSESTKAGFEKCDRALGTMVIVEDDDSGWYRTLIEYKLGSTVPVLKFLAQQSNCFVVIVRGGAKDMRELAQSVESRKNSNTGKGRMPYSDFTLNPFLTFSNGGLLGDKGRTDATGNANFKEISTLLSLIDNRSGAYLVAAEGSARNIDFDAIRPALNSRAGASLGAYTNTAEGKVIVAALTDSFNNIVRAMRHYKMQTLKGGLGSDKGDLPEQQ